MIGHLIAAYAAGREARRRGERAPRSRNGWVRALTLLGWTDYQGPVAMEQLRLGLAECNGAPRRMRAAAPIGNGNG